MECLLDPSMHQAIHRCTPAKPKSRGRVVTHFPTIRCDTRLPSHVYKESRVYLGLPFRSTIPFLLFSNFPRFFIHSPSIACRKHAFHSFPPISGTSGPCRPTGTPSRLPKRRSHHRSTRFNRTTRRRQATRSLQRHRRTNPRLHQRRSRAPHR